MGAASGSRSDQRAPIPVKSQLYWRSRRGMLELDLLLQGFLDRGYDALSDDDRYAFVALLEYPDQLLLEILLARMVPSDPAIARVVTEIRRAAVA